MNKLKNNLKKVGKYLIDTLFPSDIKCMFCDEELNEKEHNKTCVRCQEILPCINYHCLRCGAPVSPENIGVCTNCKINNYYFTYSRSVFIYQSSIPNLIHRLKYEQKKHFIPYITDYLVEKYATINLNVDIVTSVPLHLNREKTRGFNQSKLMAEYFANKTGIPYMDLLDKVVDNVSQTTLNYKDRVENVRDVYKRKKNIRKIIKGKKILIIDDLITTGSTVSEMSKTLMEGGAKECFVLTFAHGDTEKFDITDRDNQ